MTATLTESPTTAPAPRARARKRDQPIQAGEVFGALTAVEVAGKQGAHVTWRCRCKCGAVRVVRGNALRNGNTRSCGDRKAHPPKRSGKPLTRRHAGERRGSLTLVERIGTTKNRDTIWSARCDCGNLTEVRGDHVASGRIASCGCLKRAGYGLVGYSGAHDRVRAQRGSANEHPCVDCGAAEGKREWAYGGGDPRELYGADPSKREFGCAYSLDPSCYVSRCIDCHRAHDNLATPSRRACWDGFLDLEHLAWEAQREEEETR